MSIFNKPAASGQKSKSDKALVIACVIFSPILIPALIIYCLIKWFQVKTTPEEDGSCTLTLKRVPSAISWLRMEHMPQIIEMGKLEPIITREDDYFINADEHIDYAALIKLDDADWSQVAAVIGDGLPGIVIYHVGGCVVNTARKEIFFTYENAKDAVAPDMSGNDKLEVSVCVGDKQTAKSGWEFDYFHLCRMTSTPTLYYYWLRNRPAHPYCQTLSEREWTLAQRLVELRRRKAKELRKSPYTLASDSMIGQMAKRCPTYQMDLMSINQFGPAKYGYWGEDILAVCREFSPAES